MTKQSTKQLLKRQWPYLAIITLAVILFGTTVWAINERGQANRYKQQAANSSSQETTAKEALDAHGITPQPSLQGSNNADMASELGYLIEEEKLAHDVYHSMYEKWGSRVFGNIKKSETMHQGMVWEVMKSRGLTDPRSSEIGKFTNQDLQKLYDQLVARGNQNVAEGYKVGVAIEEKDIADLKTALANIDTRDNDVKEVLEALLQGSENHLRAFNRQVAR